jgi:hypothetical protein
MNEPLSLRDLFAAAALIAWGAGRNQPMTEADDSRAESVALSCYRYADAMLAERKKYIPHGGGE